MSLASVVCCQVEASATRRALVRKCYRVWCVGVWYRNLNDGEALAYCSCRATKIKSSRRPWKTINLVPTHL